jgi:hypothetical protein
MIYDFKLVTIQTRIPDSIQNYAPLLSDFFAGMIKKLDKNSHKETPTKETLDYIMDLLLMEILEFKRQVREDKFNENSLIELMDQANFAFLAYVALRLEGVKHEETGYFGA